MDDSFISGAGGGVSAAILARAAAAYNYCICWKPGCTRRGLDPLGLLSEAIRKLIDNIKLTGLMTLGFHWK